MLAGAACRGAAGVVASPTRSPDPARARCWLGSGSLTTSSGACEVVCRVGLRGSRHDLSRPIRCSITGLSDTARPSTAVVRRCGGKKADQPLPARQLYVGSYFRACLNTAPAITPAHRVRILSARHGLPPLEQLIAPASC